MAPDDHRGVLHALIACDPLAAEARMREHLSRIDGIVAPLRAKNHAWFTEED